MSTVDITPSPRILRTLGEIPLKPWQCIAELVDNAIDAYLSCAKEEDGTQKEIRIDWSKDVVAPNQRTLEVKDNASGMSLEQLQNAVRAGYTTNDPIHNLGLFGMGFNIATARLGEVTDILTTKSGEKCWIKLHLDFDALTKSGRFEVPVSYVEKEDPDIHGTTILVSRLKQGILDVLSTKEGEIRKHLETVYTPLLRSANKFTIKLRGKAIKHEMPCVWDKKRCVKYRGRLVSAYREINESFGTSYFNTEKNRYLTDEETDEIDSLKNEGANLPANIVTREKLMTGWIGIQRYADPNDYGLDFVRNGRKILTSDKTLFSYENPLTNVKELQYPVELGTTVGGRIVGELNVDFLIPTYQKNGFDTTDLSWTQLVERLCGIGPYLPKSRKALGYDEMVEAPLAVFANAFRRCEPGTKCLYVQKEMSKRFLKLFKKGETEYLSDELWFKAAQEADQEKSTGGDSIAVDTGTSPTDDVDAYITTNESTDAAAPADSAEKELQQTTSKEELLVHSEFSTSISGPYTFEQNPPLHVKAYELKHGKILINGEERPCYFNNDNLECTYIYNPKHKLFVQYPIYPKGLLLIYLSEKFKVRAPSDNDDIANVYLKLMDCMMEESRIDRAALCERAADLLDKIKTRIHEVLSLKKSQVLECVFEASGEVEETCIALYNTPDLLNAFQAKEEAGYAALEYVPPKTLLRLVDNFPEDIFDGKVFIQAYSSITLSDPNAVERLRSEIRERTLSYFKDVISLTHLSSRDNNKNLLIRYSLSLKYLEDSINYPE